VSQQTVITCVWLGIPGLALIWANLRIWRRRHLLIRLRQDVGVVEANLLASVMPEEVRTAFSGIPGARVRESAAISSH